MPRKKWSDLRETAGPDVLAAAARRKETLEAALELRELARARGMTQEALAQRLDQAQGNVSRLLRRSDMHISTLRQVVEAMGGELSLHVRFPDGEDYRLRQFEAGDSAA